MARISLVDWTCSHNRCINPLHHPYTLSITSPSRQTFIPFAWALAQKTLSQLKLSLLSTDSHYFVSGDVSIRHLYLLSLHFFPSTPNIPTRVFSNFKDHGFSLLSQFGLPSFSLSPQGPSFTFNCLLFLFPHLNSILLMISLFSFIGSLSSLLSSSVLLLLIRHSCSHPPLTNKLLKPLSSHTPHNPPLFHIALPLLPSPLMLLQLPLALLPIHPPPLLYSPTTKPLSPPFHPTVLSVFFMVRPTLSLLLPFSPVYTLIK